MAVDTKQDSNFTGLTYVEETLGSPKTIPSNATYYTLEPNSYSDFGSTLKRVARRPLSNDRQQLKGTITDRDVAAGWNQDLTQTNLTRLLQGLFYTNIAEKPSSKPIVGTYVAVTAVNGAGVYTITGGSTLFKVNDLVRMTGFVQFNNNGVGIVTASSGTNVTVTMDSGNATAIEASPPAVAMIELVGHQYITSSLTLAGAAGTISTITRNNAIDTTAFTTFNLSVGEWIVVGGDLAANKFAATVVGYARLSAITSTVLTFDKISWVPNNDSGAGNAVRLWFGKFLKNPTNFATTGVKRTYNLERTLNSDGNGIQAEYVEGSCFSNFVMHVPQGDKTNCDLTFTGLSHTTRDGTTGIKSVQNGALVQVSPGEAPYNTASNVFRMELSVINPAIPYDVILLAELTEFHLTISNNVSGNKAIGTVGSFNTTSGAFSVSATATAYFTVVNQLIQSTANANISVNCIFATNNGGMVWDMPLCSIVGDKLTIAQDAAIMLPLDIEVARNANLYTVSMTQFSYLPTLAMPS